MPNRNLRAKGVAGNGANLRRLATFALTLGLFAGFGIAVCPAFSDGETVPRKLESEIPTVPVTVTVDGQTRTIQTSAKSVRELFASEKVILGKQDRCTVPLDTPITANLPPLVVNRITIETVKEWTPIPFKTARKLTPKLPYGQTKIATPGVPGAKLTIYRVVNRDGVETRTPLATRINPPKAALLLSGMRGATFAHMLASRGSFGSVRVLNMHASGYAPGCPGSWGTRTANGMKAGFGVVAVDPRFIPLGTRLYIENYGYAIAGDTGSAIKGNRIDLGFNSRHQAMAVGKRPIRVMILP